RLDLASSGVLLLTTDTALANRITDPANAVPRVYIVTVRGEVREADAAKMIQGIGAGRDAMRADRILLRKASARESHLTLHLREGKTREVRRLCSAVGHEVTRLKRVRLGGLELGALQPGDWRALTHEEVDAAFPPVPDHG